MTVQATMIEHGFIVQESECTRFDGFEGEGVRAFDCKESSALNAFGSPVQLAYALLVRAVTVSASVGAPAPSTW